MDVMIDVNDVVTNLANQIAALTVENAKLAARVKMLEGGGNATKPNA